ncbi:CBS domain-containing protein [Neptunicoccus cionae]|uniref:Inosine-5-monophosphate dehydrogenase n=1 Tax=Neptunicoccus cionae TaxID=2035344 RepID=A0A916VNC4_9RHOB|nr:CBS domain-containing protein [Amylibacter cionae]GGA11767.1 inosine-5-monophosphate dehydrogenase [Amylibacter cionae]
MLIKQILAGKSAGKITTVKPKDTISEAAKLLSTHRIGALVVSETGTDVLGILSERDIVRELGLRGSSCMSDVVGDLMTSDIITAVPADTAESVLQTMTDKRFRHMPVMENGAMVGLVSIGDIVSARLAEVSSEKNAMQDMIMGR